MVRVRRFEKPAATSRRVQASRWYNLLFGRLPATWRSRVYKVAENEGFDPVSETSLIYLDHMITRFTRSAAERRNPTAAAFGTVGR